MPGHQEYDDDYDYDGEAAEYCWRCYGEGYIVTCIDDICRGHGYCMHGDGMDVCPECDNWEDSPHQLPTGAKISR